MAKSPDPCVDLHGCVYVLACYTLFPVDPGLHTIARAVGTRPAMPVDQLRSEFGGNFGIAADRGQTRTPLAVFDQKQHASRKVLSLRRNFAARVGGSGI